MKSRYTLLISSIGLISACQQQPERSSPGTAKSVPLEQASSCACPADVPVSELKPDTLFAFSNGQVASVCGSKETIENRVLYSEFAVSSCQSSKVLHYWDLREQCQLVFQNDTLSVNTLKYLPVGKNFKYEFVPFKIYLFFPKQDQVGQTAFLNHNLRSYSTEEQAQVLRAFEKMTGKKEGQKIDIANQLFVAALSGNLQALSYFRKLKADFPIGEETSKEYFALERLLRDWQQDAVAK
ncbi:hypothetical protein [Hymenobacter jejuensis]|uniref:Uncharacterized protein n=1 Tax=Hymenobacter jejuensis TaxID=2502781 RepID=A0A5B8A4N7_9BACT|nr:hypothetical protein [Hymenobacter jejuensis]QDA62231.1 hypothetical protein FHG12_19950 [Hymenobacter jejuensis]